MSYLVYSMDPTGMRLVGLVCYDSRGNIPAYFSHYLATGAEASSHLYHYPAFSQNTEPGLHRGLWGPAAGYYSIHSLASWLIHFLFAFVLL